MKSKGYGIGNHPWGLRDPSVPTKSQSHKSARKNYPLHRGNGDASTDPQTDFNSLDVNDGSYKWVKESELTPEELDGKEPGNFHRVKYTPGPKTRRWMEEKDRNYLRQLSARVIELLPPSSGTEDSDSVSGRARTLTRSLEDKMRSYSLQKYENIEQQLLLAIEQLPHCVHEAQKTGAPPPVAPPLPGGNSEKQEIMRLCGRVEALAGVYASQPGSDGAYARGIQTYCSALSDLSRYDSSGLAKIKEDLSAHHDALQDLVHGARAAPTRGPGLF